MPLRLVVEPGEGCDLPPDSPRTIVPAAEAARLLAAWPSVEGVVGHRGEALAGEGRRSAWFVGVNSAQVPRYAVAVLLEEGGPDEAAKIGAALLLAAAQ